MLSISLRPQKFSEIYGQTAIVQELEKRKKAKNWPTAILLKGSTGTGKTTTAQIIAMTINCTHPDANGDPCGKCPSCLSIIEERFDRNTSRIDGSQSSKGELIESIGSTTLSPMYDEKNVFIIEETDQLSPKAKLSLLKTLEVPQKNTHYILLSMYNTGLPPELQSRCQVYNFKNFTAPEVMYALKGAMEKLGLWESDAIPKSFKIEGLRTLAETSNGSLRAGIQYLEKCLIGEYYTKEAIRENLGIADFAYTANLLQLLLDGDPAFFKHFEGVDIKEFMDYSYWVLASTFAFKVGGYELVKEEYMAATRKMGESTNLESLIQVYDSFMEVDFYKKSYITSKFAQYLSKVLAPVQRKVRRISE